MSDPWDDDKQKQLMDFLQPPGMQQGLNTAQAMGIGAPAVGGGGPPPAPTISPNEKPLAAAVKPDENNNPEQDKSNIVDSHPLAQLPGYIQGQEQQIDKYGPDQQKAVLDMIQKEQGGWQGRLGRAGTGFADAIMQGVARAGPGNFQKSFQDNQESQLNRQAAALPQLQEMNAKNMAAKQGLEQMSSSTPLGQSEALATKLLAKQLFPNLSEEKLNQVTQNPTALAKFFPSEMEYRKALAEIQNTAEFRKESLENQRIGLAQTGENAKAERIQGAAKALEGRGFLEKIRDAISPTEETTALEKQVTGGAAPAPAASEVPAGRVTVISPDGRVGHIPQSQLKAALAKGYKQQ